MENLKCEVIRAIEKDRIYCAYCDRHYALYKLKHRCHPLAKCTAKKISYTEEYLEKTSELVYDSREAAAMCESCKKKKEKNESAKKSICPGCDYTGYYIRGPDGLCPGCLVMVVESKLKKPVAEVTSVDSNTVSMVTEIAVLIPLTLYARTTTTGTNPSDGSCVSISIFGATEESLLTRHWFVETIILDLTLSYPPDYVQGKMQKLSDWLRELSKKYIFHWNETSSLDWHWVKYMYNQNKIDNRYPLC